MQDGNRNTDALNNGKADLRGAWYHCKCGGTAEDGRGAGDRHLVDHFEGKLHLGYMQFREKLAELQVESLSKDDLAFRLTLTVDSASVSPLLMSDAFITIMDTNDYCAVPQQLKDEVGERVSWSQASVVIIWGCILDELE
ncbi:putative RNA-binding protein Luc7-like 2 [Bienertia sinuspersici]